jgi:LEA14-like dessication related protein
MKRFFQVLTLVLASVFLSSCMQIEDVELGKIEGAKILNANLKALEAELAVRIKNPNGFGFTVTKSDLDLTLNGKKLGKVNLKNKVHVNAKSDESHTFTITSDLSESGVGGLPALMGIVQSRSPKIKLSGYLKVRTYLFFSKRIPVDIEQTIPLGR